MHVLFHIFFHLFFGVVLNSHPCNCPWNFCFLSSSDWRPIEFFFFFFFLFWFCFISLTLILSHVLNSRRKVPMFLESGTDWRPREFLLLPLLIVSNFLDFDFVSCPNSQEKSQCSQNQAEMS
jgi:hypothetical protein